MEFIPYGNKADISDKDLVEATAPPKLSFAEARTNTEISTVTLSHFRLPMSTKETRGSMNPAYHNPGLMAHMLRDMERHGILHGKNSKRHTAWVQLKVDLLAALTAVSHSYDALKNYMLWMALVWTIDDMRDLEAEANGGNSENEAVNAINEDLLKLVDPKSTDIPELRYLTTNHSVLKLARHVRAVSMKSMDFDAYAEFVSLLTLHLREGVTIANRHIHTMKEGKPFPLTLQQYEDLRQKDGAGDMCIHLASHICYNSLPEGEKLNRCRTIVALHAGLLNDLFSYEKQVFVEKDRFNYLCGLQEIEHLTFDQAAHRTIQRANELVQEHEDIERTIDMTNPEVAKIIDTHRRWLSGHLVWVLESGRYSSPTSCFSFLRSAPSSREVSLSPASQMTQREE